MEKTTKIETKVVWEVTCPNGKYHEEPTKEAAYKYAEWGHACLTAKAHTIRKATYEVFNECPFDGLTHKPSECPTFIARMAK